MRVINFNPGPAGLPLPALEKARDELLDFQGSGMSVMEHSHRGKHYDAIVADKAAPRPCRVYAPVGSHEDLLAYLVRRLLENGANTSFVNRIADTSLPVEQVVTDPLQQLAHLDYQPNPRIAMPQDLYGADRRNSHGFAFADRTAAQPIIDAMQPWLGRTDWEVAPIIDGTSEFGTPAPILDPTHGRAIGRVLEAPPGAVAAAYAAAARYQPPPAAERAAALERTADLLEANLAQLMALAVREAGKTLPDALGEVREAVDFCRYYANECRRLFDTPITLQVTKQGTVLYSADEIPISGMARVLDIEAQLINRAKKSPSQANIIIRADAETPTGQVQEVIKICQQKKFEKFLLRAKQDTP